MTLQVSKEYVEVSIDATSEPVTVNLTKGQDETQCTPEAISMRSTGSMTDQHQDRMALVEFIDNGGTAAVRVTAGAMEDADDVVYQIEVVEWDASVTVQQVTANGLTDTTTTTNQAITDVGDQTTAFFRYSYQWLNPPSSDDDFNDVLVQVHWNGASTSSITLERSSSGGAGDIEGVLYVVEINSGEFVVEHTTDIVMAVNVEVATRTITEVVEADTFLVHSYEGGSTTDDIDDSVVMADLQDSTTVRVRRAITNNASGGQTDSRIQVVECQNNEWDVQRNDVLAVSSATVTDTITAVDRTRSYVQMLGCFGFTSLPRSDSTQGNDIDDIMTALDLSADNTVRARMRVATQTDGLVSYEVIQFASAFTLFFQTNTGAVTPTGEVDKETLKNVDGTVTPTGANIRETLKAVAGALTPTGDVSIKDIFKLVAGSVTPTGGSTGIRLFFQTVSGAVAPVGTLAKEIRIAVAGSVAPVGVLIKETLKNLAGLVTPTGALIKETLKNLAGSITPTGALSRSLVILQSVAGAVTPIGTITKLILKALAGSATPTGAITKETQKNVAGAIAPTGDVTKETQTSMDGSVTPTGALGTAATFLQSVAGSLVPTGDTDELFIAGGGGPAGIIYRRLLSAIRILNHRQKGQQ